MIALLLSLAASAAPASAQPGGARLALAVDAYNAAVQRCVDEGKVVGAAMAVVEGGEVRHLKGYGRRRLESADPVDADTVFRMASVSKGFASTLVALLVRDGTLTWDAKVKSWVPEFSVSGSARSASITVFNLLSHTTGVVPHAYDNLIDHGRTFERAVRELAQAPNACAVGGCYGYQNVLYSLVDWIVAKAVGKAYGELVEERLLKPLGMTHASLGYDGLMSAENRVAPHVKTRRGWRQLRHRKNYYELLPAAGVNASASDLARWMNAQMGAVPEVLPQDVLARIQEPVTSTPGERRRFNRGRKLRRADYGLGWRVFDYAGRKMVFHSGGVTGSYTFVAMLPEEKVGLALLVNSYTKCADYSKFFDALLGLD